VVLPGSGFFSLHPKFLSSAHEAFNDAPFFSTRHEPGPSGGVPPLKSGAENTGFSNRPICRVHVSMICEWLFVILDYLCSLDSLVSFSLPRSFQKRAYPCHPFHKFSWPP
jgi:hypothetical protein